MTTPNTKAGLLDAFLRYQNLSVFWARNGTPEDLAVSELQEYLRLSTDIPEQIKRLIAFSQRQDNQGPEWRMLEIGEKRQLGDQFQKQFSGQWVDLPRHATICPIDEDHLPHRRRIPKLKADFQPVEVGECAAELSGREDGGKAAQQWRPLVVGETIQEGDEWDNQGVWCETVWAGTEYGTTEGLWGSYRRRIA